MQIKGRSSRPFISASEQSPPSSKNYKGNTENADIAATMGFESNQEYNEIMFLREIAHSVNACNDMADVPAVCRHIECERKTLFISYVN